MNWTDKPLLILSGWLVLALMVGGIKLANAADAPTVVIKDNPGGSVTAFVMLGEEYRSLGTRIVFDGDCQSACTLYTRLPNVCITPRASFGFHAPRYVMGPQAGEIAPVAIKYMMVLYPPWVRGWVDRNGGLTADLIVMPYSYAKQFMPTCGKA